MSMFKPKRLTTHGSRPRYLFVLPWDLEHLGGVNRVVESLHVHMRRGDLRPLLMVLTWDCRRLRLQRRNARATLKMRLRSPWNAERPVANLAAFLLEMVVTLPRLSALLRRHNIQVVNPHYPSLTSFAWALMRRFGLMSGKLVLSVHGLDILNAAKTSGLEGWLWRFMLRSADRIVACSAALLEDTLHEYPELRDRSIVIHNGVDPAVIREEASHSSDEVADVARPFVVCVASYEYRKAQDVLLRAFAGIADEFPALRLVFAGPVFESAYYNDLLDLHRSLGLDGRVLFLGGLPHNRAMALIAGSRLLSLPSRNEPFGLVLLEAGALSKAVVAAHGGGVGEIIESPRTGLLVPGEDPNAMGRAMAAILRDEALAKRLGTELQRHVEHEFVWTRAVDKYLAAIS